MKKIMNIDNNALFFRLLDKITQNKYTLFLITILIFLLEVQLFNIGPTFLNPINHSFQKILIVLMIFGGIAIFFRQILFENDFIFTRYVNIFFLYCLVESLISLFRYDLSIPQTIGVSNYIWIILAYYLFSLYVNNGHKNQFINIIMVFSLVYSVILLIQYALNFRYGVFLNFTGGLTSRDGVMRITQGEGLINIGILLAFGQLMANKFKFQALPYATLIIAMIELVLVQKTRMIFLCILIVFFLFLLSLCKKKLRKIIIIALAALIVIVGIALGSFILDKLNSIMNSYSFTARMDELAFYGKQIYENILFGMSFIPAEISPHLDYLLRGPENLYFRSDIGIIGFITIFGLIGFVWLLFLLYKMIRIAWSSIKTNMNQRYEVLPLLIYTILTSITLSAFDIQRIIIVPILLALMDYLHKVQKEGYKSN